MGYNDNAIMNCLEFRRRCLTDPNHKGREFLFHQDECENCAIFAAQTRALDLRLIDAIRVDVPENLASRVKLENQVRVSNREKSRVIKLAASIFIAIALFGGAFFMVPMSSQLHAAVTEHIGNEWESLVQSEDMEGKEIAAVLSSVGGVINGDIGGIKYASLCDFSEYGSVHIVIAGKKGPVLALILKDKYVPKARFMAMSKPKGTKIEGTLMPISNGSMAIVGIAGEDLHEVNQILRESVHWLL